MARFARGAATTKQPEPAKRGLVTKLAEVMGEVERIAKRGRNDFHKYDYATEADIAAAVRDGMARRHLILVPDVQDAQFVPLPGRDGKPSNQQLCTLKVRFSVRDGDSGEELSFVMMGQGQDAGDKATYKAMTGAEKYALLKLFLIPTGDDPERDERRRLAKGAIQSSVREVAREVDTVVLENGKAAGIPLTEFSRAQLEEIARGARAWLEKHPNADKSESVRRDLAKAEAELARRMEEG